MSQMSDIGVVTALDLEVLVGVLNPARAWCILPGYRLTNESVSTIFGMVKELQKATQARHHT